MERKRKKRKKKHYLLKLIVLLIIIGAAIFVMSLKYFDITTIKVTGNNKIPTSTVIKQSGIKVGDNIFKLNKKQVINKMKENPYYDHIEINKNLPSEIVITIKESVKSVALPYGDKFVILDINGKVLGLDKSNPKVSEIAGITIKSMDKGEKLEAKESETFEKGLNIIKLASENNLFFKEIKIKKEDVLLNVYDNLSVEGKYDNVTNHIKNGNLEKVLYDLYKKKIKRGTVKVGDDKYTSFTPTFK